MKGSADYLSKKREPEIHPVKHLYPVELSITHEGTTPKISIDNPHVETNPDLDVCEDSVVEPDVQDPVVVSPKSDSASSVLQSRRGRIIRAPKAHADFLPFV